MDIDEKQPLADSSLTDAFAPSPPPQSLFPSANIQDQLRKHPRSAIRDVFASARPIAIDTGSAFSFASYPSDDVTFAQNLRALGAVEEQSEPSPAFEKFIEFPRSSAMFQWSVLPRRILLRPLSLRALRGDALPDFSASSQLMLHFCGESQKAEIRGYEISPGLYGFGCLETALKKLFPKAHDSQRTLIVCFSVTLPEQKNVVPGQAVWGQFVLVSDAHFSSLKAKIEGGTEPAAAERELMDSILPVPMWTGVPFYLQTFADLSYLTEQLPESDGKQLITRQVKSLLAISASGNAKPTLVLSVALGLVRAGDYGWAYAGLVLAAIAHAYCSSSFESQQVAEKQAWDCLSSFAARFFAPAGSV